MFLGGPIGILAGSAVLSGGLGGVANAVKQSKNDENDEFSLKSFAGDVLVQGTVAAATAGVGSLIPIKIISAEVHVASKLSSHVGSIVADNMI